uniref:CHK domain-containing protein n=1 Tax=Heterorhabditis bacteriophora TaxID=37862 RepID=A0A1I7XN41_HETBA
MTRVLCHGDLWSANLLWRKGEGKSHSLAAIIDFQTVHLGCPAADLCLLFSACLSGKDRQERWEELLEDFYRYLEHEVDGEDMPFTLEQLKEAYRRLYPIIGFMLISMAGPILNVITNMSEEEEKQERLDVVMEKIEHILDDVIKYYSSDVVNPTKCEEAS